MGTCVDCNNKNQPNNDVIVPEYKAPIGKRSFKKKITKSDYIGNASIEKYSNLKIDMTLPKVDVIMKASLTPPIKKKNSPILNRLKSRMKSKTLS